MVDLGPGVLDMVVRATFDVTGSAEPSVAATFAAPAGNADAAGVPESVVGTGDWLTRPCYLSILTAALNCARH
ncbi:hypothetical protein StoSoilB5_13230 [Arthrobacter sp. StoSoilB5]|nr:hypothetical protein StoSoilB5_13230 [Arthrobacter sp. StoSoilB5]